jgi:hypothetical protein
MVQEEIEIEDETGRMPYLRIGAGIPLVFYVGDRKVTCDMQASGTVSLDEFGLTDDEYHDLKENGIEEWEVEGFDQPDSDLSYQQ